MAFSAPDSPQNPRLKIADAANVYESINIEFFNLTAAARTRVCSDLLFYVHSSPRSILRK
jgi:hypothetical protein